MDNLNADDINKINYISEKVSDRITKRFSISHETYKSLKKMAIDMELDVGDKISADALGLCIDELVSIKNNNDLKK
jgi:hypothetical protein